MASRRLLSAVLLTSAVALAQNEDFSPPPMIPADQPVEQVPANPPQPQYQQYPQQQPQYQQYPQQQPQYQQYPQQQQQPQYQQYPQQQPQYQQPPQQYQPPPQQQQPQQVPQATGFFDSTRTKHFTGLLAGSVGIFDASQGVVGTARAEVDIKRLSLLASYSLFAASLAQTASSIQVSQFTVMGGWAFLSSDELTLRALAGVDVMTRENLTATGLIVGANVRSMFGRAFGIDGALMVTLFPFRQLEARAGFVLAWSIFEAHFGWRVQVVDATQSGTLATLFTSSPGVNGPYVAIGLSL
ncbi:MAG: hypothetical protein ACOZQL_40550 [Myxococcota bacterium]